jgi:single-strand DNA-binding protein
MNLVTVTGNLGQDPEIFYSANSGDPIASFSLAVRSGREKTTWLKVTAFKKTAEVCETYLHKGARIIVSGYLDQDKWEKDGKSYSTIKLIANQIEFIKTDGRGFDGKQGDDIPF